MKLELLNFLKAQIKETVNLVSEEEKLNNLELVEQTVELNRLIDLLPQENNEE